MLGHKTRDFKCHDAVSLNNLVPEDNFYRRVELSNEQFYLFKYLYLDFKSFHYTNFFNTLNFFETHQKRMLAARDGHRLIELRRPRR